MKKKSQFDYFKFVPLGVMTVSLISGYTMLNAKVSQAEEKIRDLQIVANQVTEIRVSQGKTETKLDSIVELLKDLKER